MVKRLEINGKIYDIDGDSAYEIAVANGFEGTEAEWLESLKGYALTETDKEEIASKVEPKGLEPEFANSIEECTDTSKLYVLPDGYIYAYKLTEIVVGGYTNLAEPLPDNTTDTSKWVNGYRVSSSGISTQSGTTLSNHTPQLVVGDVVRIKGVTFRNSNDRYSCWDNSGKMLSNYTGYVSAGSTDFVKVEKVDDVYEFTIFAESSGIEHYTMRFAFATPTDPSAVIITVNEEIVEGEVVKEYAWANTNHAFVPNEYDEEFAAINKELERIKVDAVNLENTNQALAESIDEVEAKIEKIGTTEIPEYWQEHIDEKIATIKNLHSQYGKDCFSFVVMADMHYPSNLGKNSPLLAKRIMDKCDIKYTLCLGDMQTRGCHSTKELLLAENEQIEEMLSPIRDRLLRTEGNHDGSYGTFDRDGDGTISNFDSEGNIKAPAERETYVNNLTPAELHSAIYRKVGLVGDAHFDESGSGYYIDDTANKVRYIVLNTHCNDYELQEDGTVKYPKMWIFRFTQSQFDLVIEALNNIPSASWGVVVAGHCPLFQEIGDREIMQGVLNAYNNKNTYSGTYAGVYGYDAVSVECDFTNAKGELVGYFAGHVHKDSLNTDSGFNIITTRCDAKEENTDALNNERIAGTITEQSFDVFTVNKATRTIYATKIGAGVDRTISY